MLINCTTLPSRNSPGSCSSLMESTSASRPSSPDRSHWPICNTSGSGSVTELRCQQLVQPVRAHRGGSGEPSRCHAERPLEVVMDREVLARVDFDLEAEAPDRRDLRVEPVE